MTVDHSGVRLVGGGKDAFAARILLIRSARRVLDAQYYIWHDDLSGSLMLDEILAAAERGVRVRLLLDDNGIAGLDARLSQLAGHPNIAIRLFNPFWIRRLKVLNWLFAFKRLNRRMHAKSFTVDRQCTIIGGRNIGDKYFGARPKGLFEDLDVMAVGPVVDQVLEAFDRHWHSRHAQSISHVVNRVSAWAKRKSAQRAAALAKSEAAEQYRQAVRALPFVYDMRVGSFDFTWAPIRTVSTAPAKGPGNAAPRTGLAELLPPGLGKAENELILVSGYFVPTADGSADLQELSRGGTRVRVLTNSFAATDVGLVHAGYAPRRKPLLESGVELFEIPAPDDKPKTVRKFIRSGSTGAPEQWGRSLHAKVYVADRCRIYIGSANFDPRSAHLNTELGFVIESPALAETLATAFEQAIRNSYRLALASDGRLRWIDERDDVPEPEDVEPGTNAFTRALIGLLSRLPIERQL